MSLTRTALAITVIVVLGVGLIVTLDLFDGPHIEAGDDRSSQSHAGEPLARSNEIDFPGRGRGPATLPPRFGNTTTTTSAATLADPSTTTTGSSGSTSAPSSSTTSATTSSLGGGGSSGVLSGDVCPCSVSGTAVLEGTVNLEGDLMVMGGTLVARPGVVVNGNGFQIVFMEGGRADFQGSKVFTWSDNGSKMNLKRDIEFRNLRRIMFHGAGPSTLKYFTVADSGTPDVLGDYPVHFHLNGNSTQGTIVEGVVVVNGRNHAFVPHGSHGITFKDTIAHNIRGDAYWWDPGQGENDSNNITYDHALANGVSSSSTGKHRLSGFVLRAGSNNTVRNSAAVNISGGSDCSGFHWPENAGPNGVWTFQNNHSSSTNCNAIFVWQNDDEPHIIDGFTGNKIDHGAYVNNYQYNNIDISRIDIQALGWTINNSTIGDIITHGHNNSAAGQNVTISNTQIKTFTIDNADGHAPGHYILNNTNLKCTDIKHTSTYPGTQITINGNNC